MMITVECISIRDSVPEIIKVGNKYKIDTDTLYIDEDGDAFVEVYENHTKVGRFSLKHFKSI